MANKLSAREAKAKKLGVAVNYKAPASKQAAAPKKAAPAKAAGNPYQGIVDSVYRGDLSREEAGQQIAARGGNVNDIYKYVQDFYETSDRMPTARPGLGDNPNYSSSQRGDDYKAAGAATAAGVSNSQKFEQPKQPTSQQSGLTFAPKSTGLTFSGSNPGATFSGRTNTSGQLGFTPGMPGLEEPTGLDFVNGDGKSDIIKEMFNTPGFNYQKPPTIDVAPTEQPVGTENDAPPVIPQAPPVGSSTDAMGDTISTSSQSQKKSSKGSDAPNADKMMKQIQDQLEQAYNDMLDSLDPQYQGYKDEFDTELQKAQQEERNSLLARQMAYGTADSEQRQQAEARMAGEFADKRSSFLKRLSEQEGSQRGQLGMQRASSMADMGMKSYQMQLDAYKYQQALAQQEFENSLASLSRGSGSSATRQKNLQALLTQASNRPDGETWAVNNSGLFGLTAGDIRPYVSRANWGDGWRTGADESVQTKVWETDALGNPVSYIDERTGNIIPVR